MELGMAIPPMRGLIASFPKYLRRCHTAARFAEDDGPWHRIGGLSMSMLASNRGPLSPAGDILSIRIRSFIAERLGVNVDTVIADSHFRDDLGLDLLDVVELTMLIEKEFVKREIADSNDEIEFVGDLIQHIEFYYQG